MSVHTDDSTAGANGATTNIVDEASASASDATTKVLDDASAGANDAMTKIRAGANDATTKIRELVENYRLPGFDLDGFITARQSDIDALSKATAAAFAGAQSITEKQADLLKATLGELKGAVAPDSAEEGNVGLRDGVKKQTDLVQGVLARALDSMKEMAEAAQRAQMEVFNIGVERAQASAAELRALFGVKKN
jgi:phasin family protein